MSDASFSFVHCADLHLDSPFEGLQAVEPQIAAVLRGATFKAFDNVIDLALQERVDFLIVAGDVYDGADRSLRAQLKFRESLQRAFAAGIKCFVGHGNHDPLSGWEANLKMPEAVHRFGGQEVERLVAVERDGLPLAYISGLSYPIREVRENLVPKFRRRESRPFAIGVLHCNVGGNPSHDNYAPCTVADLTAAGMDYWALGHVHAAQILKEREPCIVYPGNTQGRNIREMGAKGCYLVRVDENGHVTPKFVSTDVVRWFRGNIDINDLTTWDDLLDHLYRAREEVRAAAEGRAAILRLQISGRSDLHADMRRADPERDLVLPLREGETERPDFVWVESLQNRTRPPLDISQRLNDPDFIGDFLRAAENIRTAENPAAFLRQVLAERPEHRVIARHLEQFTDTDLLSLLNDAETMGLDLLVPEEE
jgi:DNA repair exonuclease SbcCD nuclease subunit